MRSNNNFLTTVPRRNKSSERGGALQPHFSKVKRTEATIYAALHRKRGTVSRPRGGVLYVVQLQSSFTSKAFDAQITREGSAFVLCCVVNVVAFRREPSLAGFAPKRPLSRVRLHVHFKSSTCNKSFATLLTYKRLWSGSLQRTKHPKRNQAVFLFK